MSNKPRNGKSNKNQKSKPSAAQRRGNANASQKASQPKNNQSGGTSVAYAQPMKSNRPKIHATENYVRISHREPVGVIPQVATPFVVHRFLSLNPGLSSTFKWLSTQALGWEKYIFESLELEYVTRVPTTFGGAIMLAIDHDAADASPTNEDIMMNYSGAIEDSIWVKSLKCKLQCDNQKRFIRFGALAQNLDVKTYDVGNAIVATSGTGASAINAGKVYVKYTVKMFIPQLPPSNVFAQGGTILSGGAVTPANPFGNAPTIALGTTGVIPSGIGGLVSFPNIGQFLTSTSFNGTGLVLANPTVASGAATVTDSGSVVSASGAVGVLKSIINVTAAPAVLDFAVPGSATVGSAHMDVATAPGSIL